MEKLDPRRSIWWIETGEKVGYYTLHRRIIEKPYSMFAKEYTYVTNLATDWKRALAKFERKYKVLTTKDDVFLFDFFNLVPMARTEARWRLDLETIDPYRIPFGKYKDRDFRNVPKPYLAWFLKVLCEKKETEYYYNVYVIVRTALALYLEEYLDQVEKEKNEKIRAEEEKRARAEPVPQTPNRERFSGTILGFKDVEGNYGWTIKMLFQDDRGFVLWGSKPTIYKEDGSAYGKEELRNNKISFDARVTRSRNDPKFGFYSRPTKAQLM